MKYSMPEISWHGRDPVYSVDFLQSGSGSGSGDRGFHRLATGGIDQVIRMWKVSAGKETDGKCRVEFLSNLKKHQVAINVVRFDPSGEMLASGDVEAVIYVWRKAEASNAPDIFGGPGDADDEPNKEEWTAFKSLRHHVKDVCDLSWSPDSLCLASVSVDKSLMVWSLPTGKHESLKRHRQFPNGVAWDPRGKYLVTLGTDREMLLCTVRKGKPACLKKVTKSLIPGNPSSEVRGVEETLSLQGSDEQRLFLDDSLMSFVRRPAFSPRGELLIAPAGSVELKGKAVNSTFIFSRANMERPCVILPCPEKATVAVRCSPVLYQLDPEAANLFKLPYRVVFAVLSQESILLYHSQQQRPFAYFAKVHYCSLTDLTWSDDGLYLVVSSLDGFCSLITFEEKELGVPVGVGDIPDPPPSPLPSKTPKTQKKKKEIKVKETPKEEPSVPKPKKTSENKVVTLDKLWQNPGKRVKTELGGLNGAEEPGNSGEESLSSSPPQLLYDSQLKRPAPSVETTPTSYSPPKKMPRRVNFVTLDRTNPQNLCSDKPEFCPKILPPNGGINSGDPPEKAEPQKNCPKRATLITLH